MAQPVAETRKGSSEPIYILPMRNFQLSDYGYGRFAATLPAGWDWRHALKREFWAQTAHLLQGNKPAGQRAFVGSLIDLRSEDHAFFVTLYVEAVREAGLDVKVLKPDADGVCWLHPKDEAVTDFYKLQWNVSAQGYDIVRKSDGAIVSRASENKTKADALKWIAEAMKGR